MLTKLFGSVYRWEALEVAQKRRLNGYLLLTRVGPILIDPPGAESIILEAIEALGDPKAVILTGRPNERRAKQYQDWYGAKVFAPEADRRRLRVVADHYYRPGETLPGGFRSVGLPHQRTAGESALFHPQGRLLVAGHLVGDPPGTVQMEPEALYRSFPRAFQAQLALLELDFDILLPGRGEPLLKGGRTALATFLAGYSG